MKSKLLFVPLTIIYGLYLIIWVVVPAYTGPEGAVATKNKLTIANNKLDDIKIKQDNALNLANSLNYNKDQQETLQRYLPVKKQEEDVIVSLNSITTSNGVLITSINMKDILKKVDPMIENGLNAGVENVSPVEASAEEFAVYFEFLGKYESIKNVIVSLTALKRFNNISALEIKDKADEDSDLLVAKVTVVFNYFNKITSITSVDDRIFADGKFDTSIMDDIKKRTIDVPRVNVGLFGRTNPFAL
ncbi:MAG: hypothetical protein UT50_C0029G0004 [Candidatus Moranbacteria bacterium GW2011_GWA2_39_41]|nr:MAG: hypothetical protein UT50_C0029G0004 [Candidatus Moranbacteria bacterium GW2011_GWA2_39_41]